MTEAMRNTLAGMLDKTIEPISGLSLADLCVVKGIKFDAVSEKFLVYLDMQRVAFVTSTFFYMTGKIQVEEIISEAMRSVFPRYVIRFYYVGKPGKEYKLGVSR